MNIYVHRGRIRRWKEYADSLQDPTPTVASPGNFPANIRFAVFRFAIINYSYVEISKGKIEIFRK